MIKTSYKKERKEKGITLIALVITIVVLLILAGVSITALVGENGLITRAKLAAEKTNQSVQNDITAMEELNQQLENLINGGAGGNTTEDEEPADTTPLTVEITVGETTENSIAITVNATDDSGEIASYKYYLNGTLKDTLTSNSYTFTGLTAGTEYTIKVEAYDKAGNMGEKSTTVSTESANIPTSTSYVGYYADVDGNESVDGVIYADLAIGGSGQWYNVNGNYTIPKGNNFKKYGISQTNYTDDFGTKDVIKVTNSSGNERFYVMALDDVDSSSHCWYDAAYDDRISDYSTTTSGDFGTGKTNTATMIAKWNAESYGKQNANDMWGVIQDKESEGWYVPSRAEWAAFSDNLGITISNHINYGLSHSYWSSSLEYTYLAWYAVYLNGFMNNGRINDVLSVRLGVTF